MKIQTMLGIEVRCWSSPAGPDTKTAATSIISTIVKKTMTFFVRSPK